MEGARFSVRAFGAGVVSWTLIQWLIAFARLETAESRKRTFVLRAFGHGSRRLGKDAPAVRWNCA
jgi:hypothetical protein